MLSAVSPKEPPERGWSAHALSFDLQVFTCHGLNGGFWQTERDRHSAAKETGQKEADGRSGRQMEGGGGY